MSPTIKKTVGVSVVSLTIIYGMITLFFDQISQKEWLFAGISLFLLVMVIRETIQIRQKRLRESENGG